jgi:hypothetical protein
VEEQGLGEEDQDFGFGSVKFEMSSRHSNADW